MEASEVYSYRPLRSPTEIRLFSFDYLNEDGRLAGTLLNVDLDWITTQGRKYAALSYAWGEPRFTHSIWVDGKNLPVTKHLYDALSCLGDCPLWVDAICIDQQDSEEKALQIPLMGRIYSEASEVFVWLGLENELIVAAMEVLEKSDLNDRLADIWQNNSLAFSTQKSLACEMLENYNITQGLSLIFENDWFTRLWVVQEMLSETTGQLVCGKYRMHYSILVQFALSMNLLGLTDDERLWSREAAAGLGIKQCVSSSMVQVARTKNFQDRSELQLIDMLWQLRDRKCADPRDRLYALGGVVTATDCFPYLADYIKDVRTVYTDFAIHIIEMDSTNLIVLALAGLSKSRNYELPSWIADWSTLVHPSFSHDHSIGDLCPYRADGRNSLLREGVTIESLGGQHTLSVPILLIDSIERLYNPCSNGRQILDNMGRLGCILGELLRDLVDRPDCRITWQTLWPTLVCDHSLSANQGKSIGPEDHPIIAAAVNYAIFQWQRSGWSSSDSVEVIESELGQPLAEFMQLEGTLFPKELEQRIKDETTRLHELIHISTPAVDDLQFNEALSLFAIFYARFVNKIARDDLKLSLCRTTSGRIGWAPGKSEKGDQIGIVALDVPLVFRPCSDGTYKLVGEAYVHDLMDGSMVKDSKSFESIRVT